MSGEFRERVLQALDRTAAYHGDPALDPSWALGPDHHIHTCPSCKCPTPDYLAVWFAGATELVDFYCWHWRGDGYVPGCSEAMIVTALGNLVELDTSDDERRQARVEFLRARREAQIAAHLQGAA